MSTWFSYPPFLKWYHSTKPRCVLTGCGECSGAIELHHCPPKSHGWAASDFKVIPVCSLHHVIIQPKSIHRVNVEYDIDIERIQEGAFRGFMEQFIEKPLPTAKEKKRKQRGTRPLMKTVGKF